MLSPTPDSLSAGYAPSESAGPSQLPVNAGAGSGPDRQALQGILFVLHTGIAWRHLPLELGFGSGSTCYRRLDEWQQAGVWQRLHQLLLAELRAAGQLKWERAIADSSHVQAKKGGAATGPSPVDRGRTGSKHHLLVDASGFPLAWTLTGGNRNDVTR